MTAALHRDAPGDVAAPTSGRLRSALHRLVRGPEGDPPLARPALLVLLGLTAVLYLWGLGASGWANSYYSAAAQAGSQSWKALFFAASDAGGSITVDKTPASVWVMGLSVRLFGLSSWSILVPQALMGVATVGCTHAAVRRWSGPAAGLLAGAVVALTPVATLMFRFNNPDALLVLVLTAGAWALTVAIDTGRTRWVVACFALVGVGFMAKMLQAFLVVPAFGFAYLLAAPGAWGRRIRQLLLGAVALVVSSGWWVAVVELWPAGSRPYVGGSQENSVVELLLGYNGLGRLTGDETGSVGGGGAAAGGGPSWGPTGLTRLFGDQMGAQASWLLPAALVALVVGLVATARAPRTDRTRAALVIWGGWLVLTGLTFSLGEGIIHEYYTVALAPPIGALVAIGATRAWARRSTLGGRAVLAVMVAITGWWATVLLARIPDWAPQLRPTVGVMAAVAAVGLLLLPAAGPDDSPLLRRAGTALGVLALVAALAGPAAYSLATASEAHTGSIPLAGPESAGGPGGGPGGGAPGAGGPGGGPGGGALGGAGTTAGPAAPPAGAPTGPPPGMDGTAAGGAPFAGGQAPGATGQAPGADGQATTGQGPGAGGGMGGLLDAGTVDADVVAALQADADAYDWVAATIGANRAAGYQLAAEESVMPIGGFNGSDPSPTLEQLQEWVAEGRIHWFIAGDTFGAGQGQGGSSTAEEISAWVEATFPSTEIGGVTLYDLTAG